MEAICGSCGMQDNCGASRFYRFSRAAAIALGIVGAAFNVGSYYAVKSDIKTIEEQYGGLRAYKHAASMSRKINTAPEYFFYAGAKIAAKRFIKEKDEFGPYEKAVPI